MSKDNESKYIQDKRRIDEIAKRYYDAKQNGNKGEERSLLGQLYLLVLGKKSLIDDGDWRIIDQSPLTRDLLGYLLDVWSINDTTKAYDILHEFFLKYLIKYDYKKDDSFCAYANLYIEFYMLNDNKKIKRKIEITNEDKTDPENEEIEYSDPSEYGVGVIANDGSGNTIKDTIDLKMEKEIELKSKLSSVIINFYKHNIGKAANEKRLSYYRIFFTEDIITLISESGHTKHFNKAETYESTDGGYVRFISFSGYDKLDDLLSLRYKKNSDVFENYSGEDKELSVPCEADVIVEYRFRSGLDKKRVTRSAVSQQKSSYTEQLRQIMNDLR